MSDNLSEEKSEFESSDLEGSSEKSNSNSKKSKN